MTDDNDGGPDHDGPAALGDSTPDADVRRAAAAAADGDLVVYPTETVYGLGGDALDPDAVERVFELKGRAREKPLSLGVASVDAALRCTRPTEFAVAFARAFLPGPVTVVVERDDAVPDALTAGRDRVGLRVPDHPVARELLDAAGPLTATSANVSGTGSVTDPVDLGDRIREGVAAVVDDGETPGSESTVVDPDAGTIHRRGAMAGAIEAWLDDPPVDR
ncbi:L-threonylcarbamoyladenylate synthase [Halorubrum laminariae]|uniref:L-threonylcarbamoyladenylate synthase n=1 Tax=Halorubrum laminariae TaxID=1433523 RepID=A0ABD6BZF1_9EURY|nr:L-threonylcarbamoyladenylate synthase [Halorubrum laminariae]